MAEFETTSDKSTGVLVVHGIGVQAKHDTLDSYGGAIERMWINFLNEDGRYTSERKDAHGHKTIELRGDDATITIGEGHWDPVVETAPSTLRLAYWLVVVVPASLLFSCRLPARGGGQSFGRWLGRCGLILPILSLLIPLLILGIVVLSSGRLLRIINRERLDAFARTIGDAFHFTSSSPESELMVSTVVERARELAVDQDRLVVVAHSQGAAVTWRALGSERWPSTPTEVITLGSGHLRLLTLRSFRRRGVSRIALALWNFCTMAASAFLAASLAYAAYLAGQESTLEDGLGNAIVLFAFASVGFGAILVLAVGLPMLFFQRRVSKVISQRIQTRTDYWLDIWSTHDVVPDGVVARDRATLRVMNRCSLLRDHTTYHENAPSVIAPIIDRAAPSRLIQHHELVQEMRRRRSADSNLWWKRKKMTRRLRSRSFVEAEFRGTPFQPSGISLRRGFDQFRSRRRSGTGLGVRWRRRVA